MLPTVKSVKAREVLKAATIRDFSGGWNILDDDLNLDSKFSVVSKNIYVASDNCPTSRFGTRLFIKCNQYFSSATSIVNFEYFNGALIIVGGNGEVLKGLADGSATRIWDAGIAAGQPGAPAGWGATTFASFAQFNGELIICNGSDKPLIVRNNFTVEYLRDEATGSNLNVPICKYVTVASRYMVMSGDPVNPDRVHISAKDTSGTWFGDPPPNDGTYLDVGSILANATIIRGCKGFRGKVIVAYGEGTVIGTLGIYDTDGNHTPNFDESVEQYGAISHRSMVSYGDDMLMMDLVGVPSLKRTVFTGTLRPERVSDYVDSEMSVQMESLSFASLEDRTFSVYDQREGQFMFFIPNADTQDATTETLCYAFIFRPSLRVNRWASFRGWNWTCGCRSLQGELFFGDKNGNIWLYGSSNNPISVDFLNDPNVNSGAGIPISFDWELPWLDINMRVKTKTARYISFDTRGTSQFTVSMYTDRYKLNSAQQDAPALQTTFTAGDVGGFGNSDQPYGGGRNTSNEFLYQWPAKFMLMKLRLTGEVTTQFKLVSMSLHYLQGGINR